MRSKSAGGQALLSLYGWLVSIHVTASGFRWKNGDFKAPFRALLIGKDVLDLCVGRPEALLLSCFTNKLETAVAALPAHLMSCRTPYNKLLICFTQQGLA